MGLCLENRRWGSRRRFVTGRRNQRRLRSLSNSDALNALTAVGDDLVGQWDSLDLSRQHAIIKAVVDHIVIHPLLSGPRFNPMRAEGLATLRGVLAGQVRRVGV